MERRPPATVSELDEMRARSMRDNDAAFAGLDPVQGYLRLARAIREADAAAGLDFSRLLAGNCAAELPVSAVDAACRAYWNATGDDGALDYDHPEVQGSEFVREYLGKGIRAALAAFGHAMAPVDPLPDDVHEAAADARALADLTAAWDAFELGQKVPERLDPGRVASTLRRLAFLLEVTLERLGEAQAGAALNAKWLGEAHARGNAERQRADTAEAALTQHAMIYEARLDAVHEGRTLPPAALASIGLGSVVLADTPEGRPPCYVATADVFEVNRGTCTSKVFGSACDGCGFRLCIVQADAVREEC